MSKKSKKAEKRLLEEAAPAKASAPGKGAWRLMDRGASIAAGALAGRISALTWKLVTGKKPPVNGRHPDVSTKEAVAWAVIGGATIELVKVAVRRGTATYWVRSTGSLPPGMKPLATSPAPEVTDNAKEPVPTEPAPHNVRRFSLRSRGR
ncbi:hypothetical protein GCM10022234_34110 [Aeromicrobium panaciterrae]|uniref:DUF4235 domain-containing protein n=1 Tax=Aeromicrobium panaciterrae TaxID=363861 RepID=UPI0031D73A9C